MADSGVVPELDFSGNTNIIDHETAQTLSYQGILQITNGGSLTILGNAVVPVPSPPPPGASLPPVLPSGQVRVDGAGSTLAVGGTLFVAGGSYLTVSGPLLSATDGAAIQAGNLTVTPAQVSILGIGGDGADILVDSTSSLEVGAHGGAAAGSMTIDQGATASVSGVPINASSLSNAGVLALGGAAVTLSGVLTNTGRLFGVSLITASGLVNDGLIVASGIEIAAPVTGVGTIIVTGGVTFDGKVDAGQTIDFATGDVRFAAAALDGANHFESTLIGFRSGDHIDFTGAATSVAYADGVLTLYNGVNVAATFDLVGDYAGSTFSLYTGQPGVSQISVSGGDPRAADDFLRDGASQLLLHNANGALYLADLTSGQAAYQQVGAIGAEWAWRGAGDLYLDGRGSMLLENTSGVLVAGEVGSDGQTTYRELGQLGPDWSFHGVGDFLGDGHDDYLIENGGGALVVGQIDPYNVAGGPIYQADYTQVGGIGAEWTIRGAGHFLADGKAGFLMENTAGAVVVGEVAANHQSVTYTQVAALGPEWTFEGFGDLLGDGRTDFLIQNTAGQVVIGEVAANGQAAYTAVTALGAEWKFVGVGDYLGEGHDQFMIQNTAGVLVIGDDFGGHLHFSQAGGLGPEWSIFP